MNQRQKNDAAEVFDLEEDKWIMFATLWSMGTSLNLQRANFLVLESPSHKLDELKQYLARADRRGQNEPEVYGFTFVNEASGIEKRMIKSHNFADLMQNSVYEEEAKNNSPSRIDTVSSQPIDVEDLA
jgi:hypothetical protein